jgi:hypothetical protein
MEDYAFQASFWDNLTMGGGEGKTNFIILLFERSRVFN